MNMGLCDVHLAGKDDGLVVGMVFHDFDNGPTKVAGAASNCYFDHRGGCWMVLFYLDRWC